MAELVKFDLQSICLYAVHVFFYVVGALPYKLIPRSRCPLPITLYTLRNYCWLGVHHYIIMWAYLDW